MSLRPPEELSFTDSHSLAERWRMWSQEMRLYIDLTMAKEAEKDKCSAFLYIIGRSGREIYNTWTIPEEEENKLEVLFRRFDQYCKPKHVTLERYKFNSRVQQPTESLDEFVTDLQRLTKLCQYENLEENMVRDRIAMGIKKMVVKERLLREPDLTLESAISICRADEESRKGLSIMPRGAEAVNVVKKKKYAKSPGKQKTVGTSTFHCNRCRSTHGSRACPVFGKTCNICKKRNHFANECRAKKKFSKW